MDPRRLNPKCRVFALHELERQEGVTAISSRAGFRRAAAPDEHVVVGRRLSKLIKRRAVIPKPFSQQREVCLSERAPCVVGR